MRKALVAVVLGATMLAQTSLAQTPLALAAAPKAATPASADGRLNNRLALGLTKARPVGKACVASVQAPQACGSVQLVDPATPVIVGGGTSFPTLAVLGGIVLIGGGAALASGGSPSSP